MVRTKTCGLKSESARRWKERAEWLASLGEDADDENHEIDLKPDQEKTLAEVLTLLDAESSGDTTTSSEDEEEDAKPRIPSSGMGPASQAPASARIHAAPSPAPAPKRARLALSRERAADDDDERCPTCGRSEGRDAEAVQKLKEFGEFLHELGGTLNTMLAWPVMAPGEAGEADETGEEGKMGGGAGEQEGA
ncbi:hypothetical protein Rhopal_002929-T1 [Rhodotorula paludigena]|uniref:Uncharacterized protein n=1 Tax=Rhodotorula paludigena TaxID=86838 RepID=A0AAV5GKB4_9BASI|nr:hypothetical protein Rhopal_002929-T1 [Rhodotorula paludigena]